MPRKKKPTKLDVLKSRIADARRIIDAQQVLLEGLRNDGEPTQEAEAALRTYASALMHLLPHEEICTIRHLVVVVCQAGHDRLCFDVLHHGRENAHFGGAVAPVLHVVHIIRECH